MIALATATATTLRPLGDRVVIQPTPREEMTKSGIVLPDTAKEKPQEGSIIAAGPGRLNDEGKREPMDVKVGDKVLYAKYAGTEFKVDGEELPHRQPEGHPGGRRGLTPGAGPPASGSPRPADPLDRAIHLRKEPTHGQAAHLRRDRSSLPQARRRQARRRGHA